MARDLLLNLMKGETIIASVYLDQIHSFNQESSAIVTRPLILCYQRECRNVENPQVYLWTTCSVRPAHSHNVMSTYTK